MLELDLFWVDGSLWKWEVGHSVGEKLDELKYADLFTEKGAYVARFYCKQYMVSLSSKTQAPPLKLSVPQSPQTSSEP